MDKTAVRSPASVRGVILLGRVALAIPPEVQVVNYLAATGTDEALLLNFGATRLEFKKKFRQSRPAVEA